MSLYNRYVYLSLFGMNCTLRTRANEPDNGPTQNVLIMMTAFFLPKRDRQFDLISWEGGREGGGGGR